MSEAFSRKLFHKLLLGDGSTLHEAERSLGGALGICVRRSKRQYRSRIQIAANILEIARQGSRKTRIMYLGNLSFDLLQKYLDLLAEFGLMEAQGGKEKTYVATEKGRRFLDDFRELEKYSEMAETKKRALEASLTARA